MPFLNAVEQDDLQKHLSGMTAGFTLGPAQLTLRTKTHWHTYVLIETTDVTLETCYFCNTEIPSGRAYDGYISCQNASGNEIHGPRHVTLCYDCYCPK